MQTPSTNTSSNKPAPTFEYKFRASQPGKSGGLFYVCINGSTVCEAEHWAFTSCGVATLFNFKQYNWMQPRIAKPGGGFITNWDFLEEHHDALFQWMQSACFGSDTYIPKEFLMALSDMQVCMLPKMLAHRKVRLVDQFMNKSHGPSAINIYRISCLEDFNRK